MTISIFHRGQLALLVLSLLILSISCATKTYAPKIYAPKGSEKRPAIIVLHTSYGISSREREFASRLARDGYVAVAVDYFTRGGTDNIDLAYDTLIQHPRVKKDSIGMVGFSKGSSQAIRFAYRSHKFEDRRVKAIVSYYIGPWVPFYYSEYFPNMLFLHGDQDAIPSSSIERVCEIQSENGLVCEAVIYPGIGHNFDMPIEGPDSYDPKVAKDAYQRTLEFFAKYLD